MLETTEDEALNASSNEKAHAKRLLKRIKAFQQVLDDRAKGWVQAREYADGSQGDDGEEGLVRVNLIGSTLETVQPAIYAKAPEIAVTLEERPTTMDYATLAKFAETMQDALNVFLVKDAKLKARGKAAVRCSLTSTVGWGKVIYQIERRDDPLIKNRINDTQDNVDRINLLLEETKQAGGECADHEAKIYELKQQITALQKQIEVVVSEGLVVDVLSPEDVIILDSSCRDIDEFMQAPEIAHRIRMTVGAFKTQFGKSPPTGAKKYLNDVETESKDADEDDYIVNVYEVWSLKDLTVYTICEGANAYIRDPYQPEALGEQWYPFFGLQLRRVDGVVYPRSMTEQLIELQDEYNTRRTNAAEHRKKNIPVRLLNKASGITDAEVSNIVSRSITTDVIGVTMDAGTPLQQQLASLPEIPYNPQMYDTTDILRDMETVGNTQDAARGAINKAKTATEAEIMAAGMQSRTSELLDIVEDWLSDIAIYSAQLLLQNMSAAIIKTRFGAEAVWPELDKRSLFNLVNINIRAGSTSKPNRMREREQWMQVMPLLQEGMEKAALYKEQGRPAMAKATIMLMDETLKRFDEKMDAKELMGLSEEADGQEEPQEQTGPTPEMQQSQEQMMQMQQIMEQTQAEMAKLQQENALLKQGVDVKHREIDLKNREVDLKERDVMTRENASGAEIQEKHASISILQQLSQQTEQQTQVTAQAANAITQAVYAALDEVAKKPVEPPRHKQAVARKNPDGSWSMESIEVQQ